MTQPPFSPQPGYQPPARARLADRLGVRLHTRAQPRFGVSLAAVGGVLVLGGSLVWGAGYLASGMHVDFAFNSNSGRLTTHGQSRRFLGFALFLICTVAGYATAVLRRVGPLATAGAVTGAFALPLMLVFVSFDASALFQGGLPISVDAVYVVSILAWLLSYFALPGMRGRPFLLGISGAAIAAYIALKSAGGGSILRTAVDAVATRGATSESTADAIAAIGLIFGLGYYAIAALLDRRGYAGAATGLVYAGFVTTVNGIGAAAVSIHMVGTGLLLIVLGAVLGWYGSRAGRRFTAWAWLVGLLAGVVLVVAKAIPHSYTGAGIALIVVGVVVALGAQLLSGALREAPDLPQTGVR